MVTTHISDISKEIDGKTFIFLSKPSHVTHQIDCLREIRPVLMVSTHIYGVSKEIHGETFIFLSKPRHVTLQTIVLEK